jgi:hypothetical protein
MNEQLSLRKHYKCTFYKEMLKQRFDQLSR